MRSLVCMLVLVAFANAEYTSPRYCGFNFMKTYAGAKFEPDCFFVQVCVRKDNNLMHFEYDHNDHVFKVFNKSEASYMYTHLADEVAKTFRYTDLTLRFLRRLFSTESQILEKNGSEWLADLKRGAPFKIEIEKSTIPGQNSLSYDIVAKVCPVNTAQSV